MAVPSVMNDLSITVSNNSPAGSESPISTDDFHRAIQAILRTTNAKASDIASAATTDIGAATAEFVDVTGTTTITGLGTIGAGIVRTVRFTGALTLTHNATSLILPSGKNISTAAGDVAMFRSLGSGNWVCVGYMRANGFQLNQRKGADVASATALPLINDGNYFDVTGTTTITSFASLGVGSWIGLHFDGALTLTHHATDLILPTGANITTAAGDEAIFVEYSSGDWRCVSYTRASGAALAVLDKIQSVGFVQASNALTATINPTTLDFRSSTLTSSTVNTRSITSAISVTAPSGATLGGVNTEQGRVALLAIDNAGTVEAAIVNITGGINLDETRLISTTAISASATSAGVIYSTTARTSVPFRIVGFLDVIFSSPSTWAASIIKQQGIGGVAATATVLNAYGDAPLFACRAWVNFNGTGTVAIRSSGNVSSITDNGTGNYTVNFSTAMPDANYATAPTAIASTEASLNVDGYVSCLSPTTTSVNVVVVNSSVATDSLRVTLSVFR